LEKQPAKSVSASKHIITKYPFRDKWRRQYGGMSTADVKRLKELEK